MSERLPRCEIWRREYRMRPYLADMPDDLLAQRFRDVFANMMKVSKDGKIGPVMDHPFLEYWTPRFAHLLEEYTRRGEIPSDVITSVEYPTPTYPDPPLGAAAFETVTLPGKGKYLAKFMKRKYAEPFVYNGMIRVAPASSYNDPSLNRAIRDDELSLCTYIPKSEAKITVIDKETGRPRSIQPITSDVCRTVSSETNYYAWCASSCVDIRLFEDFEADACVIIHSIPAFQQKMEKAMASKLSGWDCFLRPIRYIDPYFDKSKSVDPFGCKHFRFAYQKEVRFLWLPQSGVVNKLDPQFLRLGPLDNICELVLV